ncbi:MAG: metallophosphoesterase [Deltaproteobacteria bacterium]|nr:metallophosphoesterase [Deltaproteobacteria bacterium]
MLGSNARKFVGAASLCVAGFALWGFWLEPASLRNENHGIHLPHWPAACDGLRIAVLADLHVGSPFNGLDKLARIVDLTLKAKPDLILLAGDYVIHNVIGGSKVSSEEIAKGLSRLAAPLGVFAVLGNHDWWEDAPRIRRDLESVGIPVLEDSLAALKRDRCAFRLVGLSDYWEGARQYRAALETNLAGLPTLALTHNPDAFAEITSPVDLMIAAHTHGGQVYLPLLGRPIVPSKYDQRYAIGHVVENGRHLFVSSGLGTSIIPLRFLVPPEVSLLTIRAAPSNN